MLFQISKKWAKQNLKQNSIMKRPQENNESITPG
jgi:hypothetical protein